jgi:hypothetical protein
VMVPSTLIRRVTLYASEGAVSGYLLLIGLYFALRRYQHLSCVVSILVPVRDDDSTRRSGGLGRDVRLCSYIVWKS